MKRTVVLKGSYYRLGLTEQEKEEVLSQLIKDNLSELIRCMDIVKDAKIPDKLKWEATKMLFDKQATASYTVLMKRLDDKIFEAKDKEPSVIDNSFKKHGK